MEGIDRRQALTGAVAGLAATGCATAAGAAARGPQPLSLPRLSSRDYPRRIAADKARVAEVLKAQKLDGMVCLRPHNVTYFTNMTPVLQAFKVEYPAFAVVSAKPDQPALYLGSTGSMWGIGAAGAQAPDGAIAVGRGVNWQDYVNATPEQMRKEPQGAGGYFREPGTEDSKHGSSVANAKLTEREQWWLKAEAAYQPTAAPGPAWAIVHALKQLGIAKGRIGTDDMRVAYLLAEIGFDAVAILPADNVMRQIRMVKSEYEVGLMRIAQQGTQDAIMAAAKALKVGMTYDDFRRQFFTEAAARDCTPGFLLFGLSQGLLPDPTVTEGRMYMLDSSAMFRGYMGDFARTISVGEPSRLGKERFKAQQDGREAGLNVVKPGVSKKHVEAVTRAAMLKSGMPEAVISAITLHSVGLEHGDEPGAATPYAPPPDYTLRPGMTLTLDIPFSEVGWGAGHNEDMIRITQTGFEFLNSPNDPLIIV